MQGKTITLDDVAQWVGPKGSNEGAYVGRVGVAHCCPIRQMVASHYPGHSILTYTTHTEVGGRTWLHTKEVRRLIIELDFHTSVPVGNAIRKGHLRKVIEKVRRERTNRNNNLTAQLSAVTKPLEQECDAWNQND